MVFDILLQQTIRRGIDLTLAATMWLLVFLLAVSIGYVIGLKYRSVRT